jgi:hypothetical protein
MYQKLNKVNVVPNILYTKTLEALRIPMRKIADKILGMVGYG